MRGSFRYFTLFMTLGDIEDIYVHQLPSFYEREEAKAIAAIAIEQVCQRSRSYMMLHKSEPITLIQETTLIRILDELRFGKPLQYVLGEADFFGLRFKVDSSVLIPRQETEELVDWVLTYLKEKKIARHLEEPVHILDIGTGSGCIPVTIKKNLPEAFVCGLDISLEAIRVAEQNARQLATEVRFIRGDILDGSLNLQPLQFHVIVSNPPYVTVGEKEQMLKNVLDYEPHAALFVPDDDPLVFYRRIADFSHKHLRPEGALFLEINENFGGETCRLLDEMGYHSQLRKDLKGKDRMVMAWLK